MTYPVRATAPTLLLALAACWSNPPPEPRDPALVAQAEAARDAYLLGDVRLAAGLYARALERARAADFDADVADQAYNLALCRMAMGDVDGARALLAESRAASTRAELDDADAAVVEARLSLAAGDVAGAAAAAQAILRRDPRAVVKVEALVLLGEVACAGDDASAARTALAAAASIDVDPTSDQLALAHVHRLAGHVSLLDEDLDAAARSFDAEARWAREARAYGAMAEALERSAGVQRDAGADAAAAERYYRAARSRLASGDVEGARRPAELALALAARQLRPLAEALARDVEAALGEGTPVVPASPEPAWPRDPTRPRPVPRP